MPVYIKIAGLSSNKQGGSTKKGRIIHNEVCYEPIKGRVVVLKPFIDKISITYKINDPDLRAAIAEALLQNAEAGGDYSSAKNFKHGQVKYEASVQLAMPHNGAQALIQANPQKKGTAHHLRVEFNPRALGGAGIAFLKSEIENLQIGGLDFTDIVQNGTVTRADIAVDLVGIRIDDLDMRFFGGGKSHWYFSESGNAETGYLGLKPPSKNAPWITYNKRKELKDKGGSPMAPLYGGLSHTRIEHHVTPKKPVPLLGQSIENPFKNISVAYAETPKGVKTHDWQFFLDSCQRRGFKSALALVPEGPIKTRYLKSLDAAHISFWKPDVIWKAWPDAVMNSGLL